MYCVLSSVGVLLACASLSLCQEKKSAPPDDASRAAALKTIMDLYKADYARRRPADLHALAQKLLKEAAVTRDDPAARFVLYEEATRLAAQVGDSTLALRATEELAKTWTIDGLEVKAVVLTSVSRAASTPAGRRNLAAAYGKLTEAAIDADRFELAQRLVAEGSAWARKVKEMRPLKRFDTLAKKIAVLKEHYDRMQPSITRLQTEPTDAAANLEVGRYFALVKGQWDRGLPLLVKTQQPALQKLAAADLRGATDTAGQLRLGDAYWDLAETEKGLERKNLRLRAHHWYERAAPNLVGINQTKVETRLREIERDAPESFVPPPLALWTFEGGGADSINGLHGQLVKKALVVKGRLRVGGQGAAVRTLPLQQDVSERTLEVWVALATLTQRNCYVMKLQDAAGETHDGIMYADLHAKKWVNHSSFRHRTRELDGPEENARPDQLIHLAIVYKADGSITVYRNGKVYGTSYIPSSEVSTLRTYKAGDGCLIFGQDLLGEIEEARLYDRPLSDHEVAASYRIGPLAKP